MTSQAARRAPGSKPVVGSSRKISSGSPTSASAKSSRRAWPPLSVRARRPGALVQARERQHLVDLARRRVQRGEVLDRLGDGQMRVGAAALQHDADARAQLRRAVPGVVTQHGHGPAIARAVALEHLDGGRLAGPVGPQQAEDLAPRDGEIDPAHSLVSAVGLGEPSDLDRGSAARHRLHHGNIAGGRMLCGCIDIGTNTTRVLVAEARPGGLTGGPAAARVHPPGARSGARGHDSGGADRRDRERRGRAARARRAGRRDQHPGGRDRRDPARRQPRRVLRRHPRARRRRGVRARRARRRRGWPSWARPARWGGRCRGASRSSTWAAGRPRSPSGRSPAASSGRPRSRSAADSWPTPTWAATRRAPTSCRAVRMHAARALAAIDPGPVDVAIAVGGSAASLRRLVGEAAGRAEPHARAARAHERSARRTSRRASTSTPSGCG